MMRTRHSNRLLSSEAQHTFSHSICPIPLSVCAASRALSSDHGPISVSNRVSKGDCIFVSVDGLALVMRSCDRTITLQPVEHY
ncbi:hypothetical protein P171DRAFT_109886 [Karstenula rhodostoma CBS 690.94]|uniref:Uncharacterized protein n=1 Tax=Karstenula rhodostoma CBS 690.94 TaxID=1392251 RepID=A0A9P4P923_9PLEO|nr:hypothetical protein P171DRAFT_109886 [Karstenula rhodostoma CBS 690.94]